MKRIIVLTTIVLSCLLANLASAKDEAPSEVVKLEQIPAATQKTILEHTGEGKGKLGDILKVTEDGEIRYDVEVTKGKRERSFSVAPDGKLLSWQVFMNEIPPPARKTIRDETAKGQLGDIDRVVEDGKPRFEVTYTKDNLEISFSIAPDGKLLTIQVQLPETPDKVQAGIRKQAGTATIKSIEKNTEDDEIVYDVQTIQDGKKVSFSVDTDGNVQDD